jgi:hypothetical protein
MLNKNRYYETAHFFDHNYHYDNAVLRMLSLVSRRQHKKQHSNCSCVCSGMVCINIFRPRFFKNDKNGCRNKMNKWIESYNLERR